MYELESTPPFQRSLKPLPPDIKAQVDKTLEMLRSNPRHPSLHTHKRQGEGDIWQARVSRDYRIYFEFEGSLIRLLLVTAHEK